MPFIDNNDILLQLANNKNINQENLLEFIKSDLSVFSN